MIRFQNEMHPDLLRVLTRFHALYGKPYKVLEVRRSLKRQRQLLAEGATKTLNSRHLNGCAFDVAPLVGRAVSWHWPHYYPLALSMKQAAREVGVPIEWGGDWKSFKDGPHWQLPWASYPSKGDSR